MRMDSFSTFDLVKLFKISRSNIQQYIDRGLIVPSIQKSSGKGMKNIFSKQDLYEFQLFMQLAAFGVQPKYAAAIVQGIEFGGVSGGEEAWLLALTDSDGGIVTFTSTLNAVKDYILRTKNTFFFIADLSGVVREVEGRLKNLSAGSY